MEQHNILHKFPEQKEKIHELKISNNHFRKLFDEYQEVDHTIHRFESVAEATTDEHLNELKMKRMWLNNSIASYFKLIGC